MTQTPPAIKSPVYDRILTGFYRRMLPRVPAHRPQGGPDFLLMLTLGGAGAIRLADGSFRKSRRGDVSIHEPGAPQWYGACKETGFWTMAWAHFHPRPHWLEWLAAMPEACPGIRWASMDESALGKTKAAMLAAHACEKGTGASSRDFAMNFLEAALLRIREASADKAKPSREAWLEKALSAIAAKLPDSVPVPELAKIAGMSESGFAHRFKAATGATPLQYSLQLRLERAESLLLRTPMTVKEAASETGFEDPFYFSRLFKKRNGASPASWRSSRLA